MVPGWLSTKSFASEGLELRFYSRHVEWDIGIIDFMSIGNLWPYEETEITLDTKKKSSSVFGSLVAKVVFCAPS